MDTANKRSSAIFVTQPWRVMYPAPDGTVGTGDRAHSGYLYGGFTAAAAASTFLLMGVLGKSGTVMGTLQDDL